MRKQLLKWLVLLREQMTFATYSNIKAQIKRGEYEAARRGLERFMTRNDMTCIHCVKSHTCPNVNRGYPCAGFIRNAY